MVIQLSALVFSFLIPRNIWPFVISICERLKIQINLMKGINKSLVATAMNNSLLHRAYAKHELYGFFLFLQVFLTFLTGFMYVKTGVRQLYFSEQIKENIRTPHHWPLWPVNSPHKWPVTRKMLTFDNVIMRFQYGPMMVDQSGNISLTGIRLYDSMPIQRQVTISQMAIPCSLVDHTVVYLINVSITCFCLTLMLSVTGVWRYRY